MKAGPQSAARLRRLPATHWTLLVQGVDRLVPEVAALTLPFRFVPDWRIDDVMVSFAPRFGSVGPHVDSYDVFLLQGQGRRRWAIDTRATPEFRPGLDLRILRRFRPEATWVLEPGDMLYLPPGVAHHGVALEDCLTYSIGFRAPSGRELLGGRAPPGPGPRRRVVALWRSGPASRAASRRAARVGLARLRRLAESEWKGLAGPEFDAAVGALLTEPKAGVVPLRPLDPRAGARAAPQRRVARARARCAAGVHASPRARAALRRRARLCPAAAPGLRRSPSDGSTALHSRDLAPHLRAPGFTALLAGLVSAGAWEFSESLGRRAILEPLDPDAEVVHFRFQALHPSIELAIGEPRSARVSCDSFATSPRAAKNSRRISTRSAS